MLDSLGLRKVYHHLIFKIAPSSLNRKPLRPNFDVCHTEVTDLNRYSLITEQDQIKEVFARSSELSAIKESYCTLNPIKSEKVMCPIIIQDFPFKEIVTKEIVALYLFKNILF